MILTLLIFLPLAGALLVLLLPREEHALQRWVGFIFMLATFAVSLFAATRFDAAPSAPEFQLEERVAWAPGVGFSYHVGIDGIALVLVLLTGLIGPLALLSAFSLIKERVKEFVLALLFLQTFMLGAFCALDLVLFYVFWEAMLIPMYLLIGIWGHERRIYAAVKFFLYTMAGSLLMLVAILYVYFAVNGPNGHSFDVPELIKAAPHLAPAVQRWLFLAFALSFAIKVPMFPLHTWLPDAHVEAPAPGSIVLAAVLLKMGGFGFLRYAFPLFPDGALAMRPLLAALAVVGIVYGALMCLAQSDLKKLVAYSSVSHLGFVMLGLCALTTAGMTGGVYQMLNHGVSTGALFALVGILYERRHTREMAQFGGLAKVVPALAAIFFVVTLASVGLPGTNGFIGEFLILAGSFNSKLHNAPWYSTFGALGVVLGAVYMLWMYQRVFFGPVKREENRAMKDLSLREWAVLTPLVVLIAVMGVYPQPFLDRIQPSVDRLISRVEAGHVELVGNPPQSLSLRAVAPMNGVTSPPVGLSPSLLQQLVQPRPMAPPRVIK